MFGERKESKDGALPVNHIEFTGFLVVSAVTALAPVIVQQHDSNCLIWAAVLGVKWASALET